MGPNIKPEWRTSTVVAICQAMRETGDYSGCPILADALQEADCYDELLLMALRSSDFHGADAERAVACVFSDECRGAVQKIEEIADALGHNYGYGEETDGGGPVDVMDYGFLMQAAQTWLRHEDYTTQVGSEEWRSYFPSYADAFWEAYQIVTGKVVPGTKQHSFFACSC